MFQGCKELEYLDLSNFNTANVTDMSYMFNECSNLKQIKGITYFDTSNINNMSEIFSNCNKLEYPDFPNFSGSNIENNTNKEIISLLIGEVKKNFNLKNPNNEENKTNFVNIISKDKIVNISINYKNYDLFSNIEKELYINYPDIKSKNISFFLNGDEINRTSTLEENGVKNGDIILIKDYNEN